MKRINSIFFAAVAAALSLVSCSQENLAPTQKPQGELVTVHFGAESAIASTKATLTTEDEATFRSAWENGDVLSVEYENSNNQKDIVDATWQSSSESFDANLPLYTGAWEYYAVYPSPDATEGTVDFGSARTQKGNEYNSQYDLMYGFAGAYEAPAGKDDSGKDIIFEMNRQTAIVYFHLKSDLDEDVISATLSVEGEVAAIASSLVMPLDYKKGFDLSTEDLKSITITFEDGTAPKASDFQLWFNVLQTYYDKMTLTVETTGHTMSISRTSKEDTYEAGKLYKVVKEIPADRWVEKKISGLTFDFSNNITGWPASENAAKDGNYSYTLDGKNYSFIHDGGKVYCSSSYLMIRNGSRLGLPAIAGYRLAKVAGTNSSGASSSTKVDIENVNAVTVTGGESVTWSQKSSTYTYTLSDTYENTVYYLDVASTNCQLVSLVLDYEPAESAYSVSVLEVDGGDVTADSDRALPGSEITLTATPKIGYEFKGWDVKDSDGVSVEVSEDGKFTMPVKDVTISAVFSKVEYTIEKVDAANGSFTVKVNGKEATVANYGDEVTLEATPNKDYEFGTWTVKRKSNGSAITVSGDKFTMPSANISVTATFVEVAKVPEYSSLEELVEAGAPTTSGEFVTVTLKNEVITGLYTLNKAISGIYLTIGAQDVLIFCRNTPSGWAVGDLISGTLQNCKWMMYKTTWELCPNDYTELTYTPAPVISCEDVTVVAGAAKCELSYSIDKPLEGAAISVDKVDGTVVTNATIDAAKSTIACALAPNTTTSAKKGSVTIKYAHVSKTVSISQEANTLSVDQKTKTWASDATDEFVINVKVNNGASWTVTTTSLDWATVSVDNAAGTIKVKPNGANDSGAAYEGKLTVTHDNVSSLTETITLKQLQAGAAVQQQVVFEAGIDKSSDSSITKDDIKISFSNGVLDRDDNYRIYSGATLSVVAAAGYSVQKVEFTCTANVGVKYGFYTNSEYVSVDNGATASSAGSEKVGTITITGKTSKVEYKATAGQMRVTKMVVTYIKD